MRAKNQDKSRLTALKNAGDRDRTFVTSQSPHGLHAALNSKGPR